jgi:hypothetical protein
MNRDQSGSSSPDLRLAAVCGLFCPSCTFFIGTKQDRARLETLLKRFGRKVDEIECHGCRSDKRTFYCEKYCKMTRCASEKGIDFCGECSEFPCEELKEFQAQMPHRIELWQSQKRIKEAGYKIWYVEMIEHYSCPECQAINSAYDLSCRKCGATPSCSYVNLHKEEVKKVIARMGP